MDRIRWVRSAWCSASWDVACLFRNTVPERTGMTAAMWNWAPTCGHALVHARTFACELNEPISKGWTLNSQKLVSYLRVSSVSNRSGIVAVSRTNTGTGLCNHHNKTAENRDVLVQRRQVQRKPPCTGMHAQAHTSVGVVCVYGCAAQSNRAQLITASSAQRVKCKWG